jgi:hypothetical protein
MSDNEVMPQEKDPFDISNIFSKKPTLESFVEKKQDKQAGKDVPVKNVDKKIVDEDKYEEDIEENKNVSTKDPAPSSKDNDIDYKKELEKVQKILKDTQRSFHEDRKKLSSYKKAVEKMKEDGALVDEEVTMLLDHIRFEEESDEISEDIPIMRYGKIWDKEIEYMRKYSSNSADIDQYVSAFQHLIQSSTKKEMEDIFIDLSHYENDEVELTKQMLKLGQEYYEDIYSEIHEAGGLRNLKTRLYGKEQELQKKLDTLQKKYDKLKEKHEDYDSTPGNLRLPSGSGNNELHEKEDATFDVSKIFASRYKRR